QAFFLRIHAELQERSFGPVDEQMRAQAIGNDACFQGGPQTRVVHADVECIVDHRGCALKERSGRDGLRLPKQYKRLVDGVRTQIPQHSGCGLVGLSTTTSRPARRQALVSSKCDSFGVATTQRPIVLSESSSSSERATRTLEYVSRASDP